jgi:hypothetical protein
MGGWVGFRLPGGFGRWPEEENGGNNLLGSVGSKIERMG